MTPETGSPTSTPGGGTGTRSDPRDGAGPAATGASAATGRTASADPGSKEPAPRTPPRPVSEIIGDLTRERKGLVDAVDTLKLEARETKDRLVSPRTFAIVGGALASLFLLRRRRRRKHR